MTGLCLRFARPDERAALEALQRRATLMWEEYRPYLMANPDVMELPLVHLQEGWVRVAEWQGRVLGFAVLLPKSDFLELDGLFVEPDFWRRGVGRALIADALKTARMDKAAAIETVANPRAEGFYERLGFAISGRAQTQFGPANRMKISAFSAET